MSLALTVFYLIVYLVYAVAWVLKSKHFGEYSCNFGESGCGVCFRLMLHTMGPLSGAALVLFYNHTYCNAYLCPLPLLLFVALWWGGVYRKQLDAYRTAANLASIVLVQCCYLYHHIDTTDPSSSAEDTTTLLPATIALILTENCLLNAGYLAYELGQAARKQCLKAAVSGEEESKQLGYNEEREFCSASSQAHRGKISSVHPLVSLGHQFKAGFIEESEGSRADSPRAGS